MWAKAYEGEAYVHKLVVDQFWLSCFISRSDFLKKLQAPLKKKNWVDLKCFLRCVDGVHKVNHSFFSAFERHSNVDREQDRIQKWIFFFCVDLEEVFVLSCTKPRRPDEIWSLMGAVLGKPVSAPQLQFEKLSQ